MTQTRLLLGPNNYAERGSTRLSMVTSTVHSIACAFGAVGGVGGAALAPPKD
jgi:hypothetical protein